MTGIATNQPDGFVPLIPAAKLVSATLTRATGVCALVLTDVNGATTTRAVSGQEGVDLFQSLTAIKAMTLTTI